MSLGPKATEATVYHSEPIIPIESQGEILALIEDALKDELRIDEHGLMITITHNERDWQFFIKSKREGKIATKLDHIDMFVFDESQLIGESQAAVILGQNIITNQSIAVKVQVESGPAFEEDLRRERKNLKDAKRLIGYASILPEVSSQVERKETQVESQDAKDTKLQKQTKYFTFMRFFEGQSLLDRLYVLDKNYPKNDSRRFKEKIELDDVTVAQLTVKALQELLWLNNDAEKLHRDIKTDNFIISSGELKLIDLGAAIELTEKRREDAGTFGYMPPEYLLPVQDRPAWSFDCDLFQLGVVIAEIATKCNYQAELRTLEANQADLDEKKHISLDTIKAKMPDVFAPIAPGTDSLRGAVLNIIQKFTSAHKLERPLKSELEGMIADLQRLTYLKQLQTSRSTARLKRGKAAGVEVVSQEEEAAPKPKKKLSRSISLKKLVSPFISKGKLEDVSRTRSSSTSVPRDLSPRNTKSQARDTLMELNTHFTAPSFEIESQSAAAPQPSPSSSPALVSMPRPALETFPSLASSDTVVLSEPLHLKLHKLQQSFGGMAMSPQPKTGDQLICRLVERKLTSFSQFRADQEPQKQEILIQLERFLSSYKPSGQDSKMDKKMAQLGEVVSGLKKLKA